MTPEMTSDTDEAWTEDYNVGVVVRNGRGAAGVGDWVPTSGLEPAGAGAAGRRLFASIGHQALSALAAGVGEEITVMARAAIAAMDRVSGESGGTYEVQATEITFGVSVQSGSGAGLNLLIDAGAEASVHVSMTIARHRAA